jgi:hypothetical protein
VEVVVVIVVVLEVPEETHHLVPVAVAEVPERHLLVVEEVEEVTD